MSMTSGDRVALILGRAIMRAEMLEAEVQQLRDALAKHEEEKPTEPEPEET